MRNFLPTIIVFVILGALALYYQKKETGEVVKEETILIQDKDKFESVKIENAKAKGNDALVFKKSTDKDKTEWKIAGPKAVDLDTGRFDQILDKLAHLEAKHAVDDDAKDLAKYGLDKPKTTIEFTWNGKPRSLLIGQKSPVEASDYVKLADSPRVFLVESWNLTTFEDDLNAFREKQICKADSDKVAQMKIVSGADTRLFKRDDKDKDKWTMEQPMSMVADGAQVRGLVGSIVSLRADEFVEDGAKDLAKYGLDKPDKTIQIVLEKDGGTKTLLLGAKKKEDQTKIYAKREEKDTVVTISATSLGDLSKPAEDFRDKKVFAFDSTKIKSLTISSNQQTHAIERDKQGNWKFTAPYVRKDPHTATDILVKALESLRAKTWSSETPPVPAHKLAPPVYSLTLAGDGIAPIRLDIGPQTDKGRFYRVDGDKMSFTPEEDLYAKIDAITDIHNGLFEIETDKIDKVSVKHLGFEMVAKRDAKNVFQAEKLRPGVIDIHPKCLTLLEGLRTLVAERFEPADPAKLKAAGLDAPDATVSVTIKGGATIDLALSAEHNGTRAAKVSGLDLIGTVRSMPLTGQIDPLVMPGAPAPTPSASPHTSALPLPGGPSMSGLTPIFASPGPGTLHFTPPIFSPAAPSAPGASPPMPGLTLTVPSAAPPKKDK